jgi:hypothetical protein
MMPAVDELASWHLIIGAKKVIEYSELLYGELIASISPRDAVAVAIVFNIVRGPVKARLVSF